MEITTTHFKRCDVLKAVGRIDGSTAPQLETAINGINESGQYCIVLDMSGVTFVSSAGWWVMIGAQKNCKKHIGGEFVLVGVEKGIRESLDLVGMGSYFRVFDDVTEAVGSI